MLLKRNPGDNISIIISNLYDFYYYNDPTQLKHILYIPKILQHILPLLVSDNLSPLLFQKIKEIIDTTEDTIVVIYPNRCPLYQIRDYINHKEKQNYYKLKSVKYWNMKHEVTRQDVCTLRQSDRYLKMD